MPTGNTYKVTMKDQSIYMCIPINFFQTLQDNMMKDTYNMQNP